MTANRKTADETAIRTLIDSWANAIRAKDANAAISHYSTDIVQFTLAPPLLYKGPIDKKALEAWFASFQGPLGYEIRDPRIITGYGAAFSFSLNRLTAKSAAGESVDLWFRMTMGFRKDKGKWLIVHEHESVPFYMDGSYKAAVDLKLGE